MNEVTETFLDTLPDFFSFREKAIDLIQKIMVGFGILLGLFAYMTIWGDAYIDIVNIGISSSALSIMILGGYTIRLLRNNSIWGIRLTCFIALLFVWVIPKGTILSLQLLHSASKIMDEYNKNKV